MTNKFEALIISIVSAQMDVFGRFVVGETVNALKIDLSAITGGKARDNILRFCYDIDLSDEEVYFERPFKSPVRVEGCVTNSAGVLRLSAGIDAVMTFRCARCLALFVKEKTFTYSTLLARDLQSENDISITAIEGDVVELDDILVPEIILGLDMVNLCSEECRGLCPKCGADLNRGPCGCKD